MKHSAWLAMLTVAVISTGLRADPEDAPLPPPIPGTESLENVAEPGEIIVNDAIIPDEAFESKPDINEPEMIVPEVIDPDINEPQVIVPKVIDSEDATEPTMTESEPVVYLTAVMDDKSSEESSEEWVGDDIWPVLRSDDPVPPGWMFMTTTADANLSEMSPTAMQSPEPASLTLLGLGLAGIAVYRRRLNR